MLYPCRRRRQPGLLCYHRRGGFRRPRLAVPSTQEEVENQSNGHDRSVMGNRSFSTTSAGFSGGSRRTESRVRRRPLNPGKTTVLLRVAPHNIDRSRSYCSAGCRRRASLEGKKPFRFLLVGAVW